MSQYLPKCGAGAFTEDATLPSVAEGVAVSRLTREVLSFSSWTLTTMTVTLSLPPAIVSPFALVSARRPRDPDDFPRSASPALHPRPILLSPSEQRM